MKKSPLILALSSVFLLSACNSDEPAPEKIYNTTVQAYDGAVKGLVASFKCENGASGKSQQATNDDGEAIINNETFLTAPETCSVEFRVKEGGKAIDMSNNKDMTNVIYRISKGFLEAGSDLVSGNPFTTLLDKYIKDASNAGKNIEELQTQLLTDLGFSSDSTLTSAQKLGLFTNPEETIAQIKAADTALPEDKKVYSLVVAKTNFLSDLLISSEKESVSPTDIAKATDKFATETVEQYPNYPQNDSGEIIYFDVSETSTDEITDIADGTKPVELPSPEVGKPQDPEIPPVNPTPPPTGGTGTGTGSGNDGGIGA